MDNVEDAPGKSTVNVSRVDEREVTEEEHASHGHVKVNGHNGIDAVSESSDGRSGVDGGESDTPSKHPDSAGENVQIYTSGNHETEEGSDVEDEDDEEDVEEEGDDEDYEPALKYELLGGATETLLEKDSASALAVSPKYLVRCFSYEFMADFNNLCLGHGYTQRHRTCRRLLWRACEVVSPPFCFCHRYVLRHCSRIHRYSFS